MGPPLKTVEVYDAINPKRLLGTMEMQSRRPDGRDMRYAACVPLRAYSLTANEAVTEASVDIATFTYGHRPSDDGWDRIGILLTYTPLEHLMRLREFRLPGENERQLYERQRNCW